ncbi:MAG: bifunctional transaldolase/phosoglucose isomerase [Vulcanimicrobiaceae bacterium]
MGTQLKELIDCGQSIWLDNIRRSMFASGDLRRLIAGGLRGMTSNPTIFEKAIGSGSDYDEQLRGLVATDRDPNHLFEALAIDDIRHACDEFRDLFDTTHGGDGFVSLEVSPLLANDTQGTIDAAARLWKMVDRPNVMIKIPATPACIAAISETIAAGINVNVTLIFAIDTYEAVANAYIAGLEKRVAAGGPIDKIGSVASVFVSRIDSAVDKLLDEKIARQPQLASLKGLTGLANLKLIYATYRKVFESDRFVALKPKGARVQRPLWASTGTKNPAYPDLLYVENLVGKNTVNTLPPATLEALVEHGRVRCDSVEENVDDARATIAALATAGISLFDVTQQLQNDGVASFSESYNAMLAAIGSKRSALAGGRDRVDLGADAAARDAAALARLDASEFLAKMWKHDPAPWSTEPHHAAIITKALGWLDFPRTVLENVADIGAFAVEMAKLHTHVVVLGMGGSSLAPDVLRETFGTVPNYPTLHVLDSSDPGQVRALEAKLDLSRTLFVVASKSGSTIEPEAFFRYFYERVQKAVGSQQAGAHFVAITDPDTQLAREATDAGFARVFINDPDIGGRYSALSYFGMIPAALVGYDVKTILDRGIGMLDANDRSVTPSQAPGVRLGTAIATLAKAGRDKLTIVTHPEVAAFGTWAEQLVAESTGKNGVGIVPVEGESLGSPADYGTDRTFVYVGAGLPANEHLQGVMDGGAIETRLHLLEEAGHPVIRLAMTDRLDIGEQFALWEIATATAGSVLGIDAFDQPNVQESKDNTKRILAAYQRTGAFDEPRAVAETPHAKLVVLGGSQATVPARATLASAIAAIVAQVRPGDYVAFTAYLDMNDAHRIALHDIRTNVRDALKVATTVGFGPRFLHSTGQLHKGGPATGVFFQITADAPGEDLKIPGMVTFGALQRAQALGDFESLDTRGRRGVRVHVVGSVPKALEALAEAFADAVSAKA